MNKLHAAKVQGHWIISEGQIPHSEVYGNHPSVLEVMIGDYPTNKVVKVLKEWYAIKHPIAA